MWDDKRLRGISDVWRKSKLRQIQAWPSKFGKTDENAKKDNPIHNT
jgi:hypothetical protein